MTGIGQRGKSAEKETRSFLDRLNFKYASFDYERVYDARSAGGRFPARPGDFEFYAPRLHGLIEVKEVEHDFRLPRKNMEGSKAKDAAKVSRIAKLLKRQLAGGMIFVLVNHTTTGLWRSVPIDWLHDRAAAPSWDLSEFKTYASAAECLALLEHHVQLAQNFNFEVREA